MSWDISEEEWESRWRKGGIGRNRKRPHFLGCNTMTTSTCVWIRLRVRRRRGTLGKRKKKTKYCYIYKWQMSIGIVDIFLVLLENGVLYSFLCACLCLLRLCGVGVEAWRPIAFFRFPPRSATRAGHERGAWAAIARKACLCMYIDLTPIDS